MACGFSKSRWSCRNDLMFLPCFPRWSSKVKSIVDIDVANATLAGIDSIEANVFSTKALSQRNVFPVTMNCLRKLWAVVRLSPDALPSCTAWKNARFLASNLNSIDDRPIPRLMRESSRMFCFIILPAGVFLTSSGCVSMAPSKPCGPASVIYDDRFSMWSEWSKPSQVKKTTPA